MLEQKEDYDLEPVKYCAKCYSLKIKYEEAIDSECCMECGCSDTLSTSIEEWEKLYENRYGTKYVTKSNNPKNTPLFQMPVNKLKLKLYDCPQWKEIIKKLYPEFPRGIGKVDSIILLFDKIFRDNRLDDLRMLLLEYYKN